MSAGLGEAAGHVAGSVATVLKAAAVPAARADRIQQHIEEGGVLLGVHATPAQVDLVRDSLAAAGAPEVDVASWQG